MHALVDAGADVIELGVPFSDPMADGPTIQRSSERALARGAGLSYVLDTVRAFRERDADTPVVLMGYLNPVEIRGYARFAAEASRRRRRRRAAGRPAARGSTGPARGARAACDRADPAGIADHGYRRASRSCAGDAQGYLYYVSFAGVTGARPPRYAATPATACARSARRPTCRSSPASASRTPPAPRPWRGMPTASWSAARWSAALADGSGPEDAAQRARDFLAPLARRAGRRRPEAAAHGRLRLDFPT